MTLLARAREAQQGADLELARALAGVAKQVLQQFRRAGRIDELDEADFRVAFESAVRDDEAQRHGTNREER